MYALKPKALFRSCGFLIGQGKKYLVLDPTSSDIIDLLGDPINPLV